MARTFSGCPPIGVVLAGGSGRRLGGDKACAELLGAALITYPLAALRAALGQVVVLAKRSTTLPELPATEIWLEPEEPRHPLFGILCALERAEGRPVLVCAADLPLVGAELVGRVLGPDDASGRNSGVVPQARIAGGESGPQPLLGRYEPAALETLRAALEEHPPPRMRSVAVRLCATIVPVSAELELLNVNHPEDLQRAGEVLRERPPAAGRWSGPSRPDQPNVKS